MKMCSILVRPEGSLKESHEHTGYADITPSLTSNGPCLALFAPDPARLTPIYRLLGFSCRDLHVSLKRNNLIDSPELSAYLYEFCRICILFETPSYILSFLSLYMC